MNVSVAGDEVTGQEKKEFLTHYTSLKKDIHSYKKKPEQVPASTLFTPS